MDKDVEIRVKGTHSSDGEQETFETLCSGVYYLKNKKHYFSYQEETEQGKVKSIIKVKDKAMEVIKSGAVNMHLFLEPGKVINCTYDTPFGNIPIEIYTEYLNMYIENNHIKVDVSYEMQNNGEVIAGCKLLVEAGN